MADYLANLAVLWPALAWTAGTVVLAALVAAGVAGWISRGRPYPYDFDEHTDTAMAILTPDDPALARLDRWAELDRADALWPVPDGSHDDLDVHPLRRSAEIARLESIYGKRQP